MIYILLIWFMTGTFALVVALLSIRRVLPWRTTTSMRFLLAFLIGSAVYDIINVYLSGSGLRTTPLDGAPSIAVVLLTLGHLSMLVPAILFKLYLLGALDQPTIEQQITKETR